MPSLPGEFEAEREGGGGEKNGGGQGKGKERRGGVDQHMKRILLPGIPPVLGEKTGFVALPAKLALTLEPLKTAAWRVPSSIALLSPEMAEI